MTFSDDRFNSAIRSVTLNGKKGDHKIAQPWIDAMNDPRIVTEKAGFLFKATIRQEHLLLAVSPVLINGERSHHYDQHLDEEDAYTLIGDISAAGVFTILFKPERLPLSETQKTRYLSAFRHFAALLLNQGYSGEGLLNDITQTVLEDLGLYPAPQTLAELNPSA